MTTTLQHHIQDLLQQFNGDEEEAMLALYFQVKEECSYFKRLNLIRDYNALVGLVKRKDPFKGYKEMIV